MVEIYKPLEKFLNLETLKKNLIAASVFMATHELLMDALIGHLHNFFSDEWTEEEGWKVSEKYKSEVLSLHNKETQACAIWFRNQGAISNEELDLLKK